MPWALRVPVLGRGSVRVGRAPTAEYGRVCWMRYADPSPDASGSSALAVLDESWTVIDVRQGTHSLTATFTRDSRLACRVERFRE